VDGICDEKFIHFSYHFAIIVDRVFNVYIKKAQGRETTKVFYFIDIFLGEPQAEGLKKI
jgi:hypothetical protein